MSIIALVVAVNVVIISVLVVFWNRK